MESSENSTFLTPDSRLRTPDFLISVTQALSPYADFSRVPLHVLRRAAARGTMVHRICAAIILGLWVMHIPDECLGYVDSFRLWLPAVADVVLVEAELIDDELGFLGHPDLIIRMKGDSGLSICDLKTPVVLNRLWKAQLAAYRHLAEHNGYGPIERVFSLRLSPEGRMPKLDEYFSVNNDFAAFLSALNAYRYFAVGRDN